MKSDPGATYAGTVTIDCTQIEPMAALAGLPGNGMALSAVADRPASVSSLAGSCAAGRGLRVRDGVRLYRQCADGLNVSDWTLHQNRQGLPEERTASTGLE